MTIPPKPNQNQWTAIILAGQRPGVDPLASSFGETWKALVPLCGVPMLTQVLKTLHAVPAIGQIVVMGQEPAVLQSATTDGGGATILTSNANISTSIMNVAGKDDAPWPVLVTTADHPLLTPQIVQEFLAKSQNGDIAIGMVERGVMMQSYPENKRTWLRFQDGDWSGANLFALKTPAAYKALELWAEAEQDRKKAWKLFFHFGPWLALRALTRTISLRRALVLGGRRIGVKAELVALSIPEAAIDVDKVSDHELAEAILKKRGSVKI
jgi:GTP:adenosylcobinamide-phosphate guanylyltransferase